MARRTPRLLTVAMAVMLLGLLVGCDSGGGQQEGGVGEQPNHPQQQGGVGEGTTHIQHQLVVVEETKHVRQQEGVGEETTHGQRQGGVGEVPKHKLTACGSGQQAVPNRGMSSTIAFASQIYASTSPSVSASVSAGENATVEPVGSAGPDVVHSHSDLCVMNADGTGLTRLTNTPEDESSPLWSPDGERIAFLRNPGGIYVANADGSDQTKLSWPGSTMPSAAYMSSRQWAWSPNGRAFAFTSGCDMYIVPADASGTLRKFTIWRPDRRVASASPDQICPESPAWSPDSKQIAFTNEPYEAGEELYVMSVSREGSSHKLWKLTNDRATSPSWSPDGSEIAFVRPEDESAQIYKIDVGSLKETRLTDGIWPTWSPDGEKIAIVGMKGAIYVVDADGSNPTPVFDAAGVQVSEPVWQPLP